jgi:hypothetical protein
MGSQDSTGYRRSISRGHDTLLFIQANKEIPYVSDIRVPVCPLHKKSMICVELNPDTHYRCCLYECPIHWNSATSLYYLKNQGDWFSERYPN